MAYLFLEQSDFEAAILKQLLTERDGEDLPKILEEQEALAVSIVKAKLNGRFNVDAIFSAQDIDRHHLVIHYVVTIALYYFIRRNAARKVPKDYKEDYDAVMKDLERILAGKLVPHGLAKIVNDDGTTGNKPMIANRKTTNFYI